MPGPASRSLVLALAIALVAVAGATLLRGAVDPLVGDRIPFSTFFPAVVVTAFTANLPAALVATILSAVAGNFFFVQPRLHLAVPAAADAFALAIFMLSGGLLAVLTNRLKQTRERQEFATRLAETQRNEIQQERERLHELVASIPGIVWETSGRPDSPDMRMRFVSDYSRVMLGYSPEDWQADGPLWLSMVPPEDRERAAAIAGEMFDSGDGGEHELRLVARDGRLLWGLTRATVVKDGSGTPTGLRGVTLDISARKEAERRLKVVSEEAAQARIDAEVASRVKDEFLATLSHELRTPLNAILGWAHLLRAPGLPDERRQAAIETIVRNAQSQEQLIADILDVQRIMAGKLRLTLRHVDLGDVVRAAAATVQPSAEARRVRLQLLIDLGVPRIWADADRLQQVIWNLLSNAIKFAPEHGRVDVRVQRTNGHCQVVVEDNGPGIAPEFLPHIFERFRQADSSTTRTHKGLGLGLAIVKSLVEMHGGTIVARNVAEPGGAGAVFTITLPLRAETEATPAVETDSRTPPGADAPTWLDDAPSLQGITVLVVDDDADARELVGAILERCGAEVALADSAAEGLAAFRQRPPNVLISDLEMPHEDGYALIRSVRALGADLGGDVPAAALTAYASTSDRMKAVAAGFNLHMAKPVQPAELATVVASLAGRL